MKINKKSIYIIGMFLAISIIISLLSCGGLVSQEDKDIQLVFYASDILNLNTSRGIVNANKFAEDVKFIIKTEGDYISNQELDWKTDTPMIKVKLEKIPVGSSINIKISISNTDKVILYKGESGKIIIKNGENRLSIKMKSIIELNIQCTLDSHIPILLFEELNTPIYVNTNVVILIKHDDIVLTNENWTMKVYKMNGTLPELVPISNAEYKASDNTYSFVAPSSLGYYSVSIIIETQEMTYSGTFGLTVRPVFY